MSIKNEIEQMTNAMKKDKEYRNSFKATLAMSFKDNYYQYKKKTGKKQMSNEDIHIIANNGADYFLRLLCDEIKFIRGR